MSCVERPESETRRGANRAYRSVFAREHRRGAKSFVLKEEMRNSRGGPCVASSEPDRAGIGLLRQPSPPSSPAAPSSGAKPWQGEGRPRFFLSARTNPSGRPKSMNDAEDAGATHDRQADAKAVARLLRRGDYSYEHSGRRGLMMRLLFESGARVDAFTQLTVENVSFADLEVRVLGKGGKRRDVPILRSLANELRLHLGDRQSGPLFRSRQGGAYSKRRIQQLVRGTAEAAGIGKRVYPHLLRHTVAQHLADRGMPENLLQQFLGHAKPQTTQVYYEPQRSQVKDAHREAMSSSS